MTVKMDLCLYYRGGGKIEKELFYSGETLEEIAKDSDNDNNELLQYMLTHDDKGQKAFCFRGFMFIKEGLLAAELKEAEYQDL